MNADSLWSDLQAIRRDAPLIHNITNFVVMNTTANALLAIGASPVMAHAIEEVEEMAGLSRALVLNIGTLTPPWIESMVAAGRVANERGIPVVLDPVGAGATHFRTRTALRLLEEIHPAIVRGNGSEIRALVHREQSTKGVESRHTAEETLDAAAELSRHCGCVVSVSGPSDVIVAAEGMTRVHNGHPLMARVTGMGCTATAITGAFAATNTSPYQAAVHAMALMGIAGAIAAEKSGGPGSLQMHFLDVLHGISLTEIESRWQVEESHT